jgi:hypothetical protein
MAGPGEIPARLLHFLPAGIDSDHSVSGAVLYDIKVIPGHRLQPRGMLAGHFLSAVNINFTGTRWYEEDRRGDGICDVKIHNAYSLLSCSLVVSGTLASLGSLFYLGALPRLSSLALYGALTDFGSLRAIGALI